MKPETNELIRNWFYQSCLNRQTFKNLNYQNQYNVRNLLAGFLQACETFKHITRDEGTKLFEELTS